MSSFSYRLQVRSVRYSPWIYFFILFNEQLPFLHMKFTTSPLQQQQEILIQLNSGRIVQNASCLREERISALHINNEFPAHRRV